jgi:predicted metalloprotease with PDZ domain
MSAVPIALEDASLNTWTHPVDGTEYIYYPKGSLAGLLLDIMIRDASENSKSLDDVMRGLYQSSYKRGKGFTSTDWWSAVSACGEWKVIRVVQRSLHRRA